MGSHFFSLSEVPEGDRSIGRAGHERTLDEAATIERLLERKNDQLAIIHSASFLKILYYHTNTACKATLSSLLLQSANASLQGHYAI
jgi:hypothetical protein